MTVADVAAAVLPILRPVVQHEEGCVLHVYDDGSGNATIGWGSTHYQNGARVQFGDPDITQDQADRLLDLTLGGVIADVDAVVAIPLTNNQMAACCDLTYNIGAGAFATSSLLRALNRGDIDAAHADFAMWNKVRRGASLVISPDLVKRRAREMVLFGTPDGTSPLSHVPAVAVPQQEVRAPQPPTVWAHDRGLLHRLANWELTDDDEQFIRTLVRVT